jgi:hypothetical protein
VAYQLGQLGDVRCDPPRHDRFTPRSSPSCQYFAWVRVNSKEERHEKEG